MTPKETHYQSLENMYLSGPINKVYQPRIDVSRGMATIEIEVRESYFHSAGAVHGSVYFKMLDDAAFFAVNSLVREVFVLTAAFTTYLTRPISSGVIKSVGKVVSIGKSQFIAEAIAYNEKEKEIARGNGVFVKSKIKLADTDGYGDTGGQPGDRALH